MNTDTSYIDKKVLFMGTLSKADRDHFKSLSAAEQRMQVADYYYNISLQYNGTGNGPSKEDAQSYKDLSDKLYSEASTLNDDELENGTQKIKDELGTPDMTDEALFNSKDPAVQAALSKPFATSLGNTSLKERLKTRAASAAESMSPGNSILAGATRAGSWLGLPVATQVDRMNREGLNVSDLSGWGPAKLVGQGVLDAALWVPKKAYDAVAGVVTKAVPKIPEAVKAGTNLLLDFSGPVKQGLGAGLSTAMNEPTEGTQWWTNSAIPDVIVGGTAGVGLGAGSFLLKKGNMGVGKMAKAAKKELKKANVNESDLASRTAEYGTRVETNLPKERENILANYGNKDIYDYEIAGAYGFDPNGKIISNPPKIMEHTTFTGKESSNPPSDLSSEHTVENKTLAGLLGNPRVSVSGAGPEEIGTYKRPINFLTIDYSPEDIVRKTTEAIPGWNANNKKLLEASKYAAGLADVHKINQEGDYLKKAIYPMVQKSEAYKASLLKEEYLAKQAAEKKAQVEMEAKYGKDWNKKGFFEKIVHPENSFTQTMAKAIMSEPGQYATNRLAPRVSIPDQQKGEPDYFSWGDVPNEYAYKVPMALSKTPVIGRTLVPYQDPRETRKRQMKYGLPQWMLND